MAAQRERPRYHFTFVEEAGFQQYKPASFQHLLAAFTAYKR